MRGRVATRLLLFVLVAILAALAAVLWWLLDSKSLVAPSDRRPPAADAASERDTNDGKRVESLVAAVTADRRASTVPVSAATSLRAIPVVSADDPAPLPPSEPPLHGIEVEIIDAKSQTAAAHALVTALPLDRLQRRWERGEQFYDFLADPQAWRHDGADVVRADATGRAMVPQCDASLLLLVALDTRRGGLVVYPQMLESADEPLRLELEPAWILRVQAIDDAGRPQADVPIVYGRLRRARTRPPDGIATFVGLDWTADAGLDWTAAAGWRPPVERERLEPVVAIRGFGVQGPEACFSETEPPTEPIQLRVPAGGEVVLRVVDDEGRCVAIGGSAQLAQVDAEFAAERAAPLTPDQKAEQNTFGRIELDPSGETRLACFPLGLHVSVDYQVIEYDLADVEADGPTHVNERVAVALPLVTAHRIVVGHAVDTQQVPVGATTATATLRGETAGGKPIFRRVHVDLALDGEFRIDLEATNGIPAWGALELHLMTEPGAARSVDEPRRPLESMAIALPEYRDRGENDVGEIVLRPTPLVVDGTVVDDAGSPLPGVRVDLFAVQPPLGLEDLLDSFEPAADGSFECYGAYPGIELGLMVKASDALSKRIVLTELGSTVNVVLMRKGGIAGSIDPRSPVPAELACAEVVELDRPPDPGEWWDRQRLRNLNASGTFVWTGLRAGRWRVSFVPCVDTPLDVPLAEPIEVEVRSGEITRDPRLQSMRLGATLAQLSIDVTLPDGRVPEGGELALLGDPRGRFDADSTRFLGDHVQVPRFADASDVAIRVAGFRPVVLLQISEDTRVRLQPEIPCRFILPRLPAGSPEMTLDTLALEAVDHELPKQWNRLDVSLAGNDWVTALLPLPGCYHGLLIGSGLNATLGEFQSVRVAPFAVPDSADEVTIRLELDEE